MKAWAKGGLMGFIVAFIGLAVILLLTGHDSNGWKCLTFEGPYYCSFTEFASLPVHWAFILFFSWVGFIGGLIDARLIRKTIEKKGHDKRLYLKITSTIMLTLVIVFAAILFIAFDIWVKVLIYSIIFIIFVLFISWLIGKWKYH